MAKILIGIVAALACFVLAESLDCNKCSGSLLGICLNSGTVTCANGSVCYTSKAAFSSISGFSGFNSQGCTPSSTCNANNTATQTGSLPIIGLGYTITTQCCKTAKCNPATTGAASTSTVSLSMLSVAALAATMRSFM